MANFRVRCVFSSSLKQAKKSHNGVYGVENRFKSYSIIKFWEKFTTGPQDAVLLRLIFQTNRDFFVPFTT